MAVQKREVTSGEMLTDKVELVWRIENYSMISKSEIFRSWQQLEFQAGSSIGLESDWVIYFVEEGETSQTPEGTGTPKKNGQLWIWLKKAPAGVQELMASLRLRIKTETDAPKREISTDFSNLVSHHESGRNYGWCVFNDAWDLPLINGCMVMELELTLMTMKYPVPQPFQHQGQQQIEALFNSRFAAKIQSDFTQFLEGSLRHTDAKIILNDQVQFQVHRCVLSQRSPVFETMFKTRMTETQTGIVTIPDISSKTMTVLLQFIYKGTLHPDWSDVQVLPELVYAANKYELQDLVDFLDQIVGRVCSKENAGRLFSLLGKLGMKTGEREVLAFIKSHMTSFEGIASFVEEGSDGAQKSEQPFAKSEKWNVLRSLRNSWRRMLGGFKKSSSQKTNVTASNK